MGILLVPAAPRLPPHRLLDAPRPHGLLALGVAGAQPARAAAAGAKFWAKKLWCVQVEAWPPLLLRRIIEQRAATSRLGQEP